MIVWLKVHIDMELEDSQLLLLSLSIANQPVIGTKSEKSTFDFDPSTDNFLLQKSTETP